MSSVLLNKKILVITPTYNERKNIDTLINRVHVAAPMAHILVVDDNSPDGTGDFVKQFKGKKGWVHLIERPSKMGLGTAYCTGFLWALENSYDIIMQIDADLSHDPAMIPEMLNLIQDYDLVIGSRYIKGVNVVNWPLSRLMQSWSANIYAKVITGVPVWDLTGGFKCWRRYVLENLDIKTIRSEGYSFQIETTFRAYNHGARIKECQIVFTDRTEGASKMSRGIIREAIWMVIWLKLCQIINRIKGKPHKIEDKVNSKPPA